MESQEYMRDGNTTMCFYRVKSDLVFVGFGEHEDPEKAKRLAYDDAANKAKVISINKLAMYRSWKMTKARGY